MRKRVALMYAAGAAAAITVFASWSSNRSFALSESGAAAARPLRVPDPQRVLYDRFPKALRELFEYDHSQVVRSFVHPQDAAARIAYVSGGDSNAVYGYDDAGQNTITIGGLDLPTGLFVDSRENLWVANGLASNILVFARNGTSPIMTLNDPSAIPNDVTVCPNGTVYVSNVTNTETHVGGIVVYAPGNTNPTRALADPYELNNFFITCDTRNNVFTTLYVSTNSSAAVVDEYVGGVQSGFKRLPISLLSVGGIKPDNAGNIVVSDSFQHTISEYTESGSPTGVSVFTGSSSLFDIALTRSGKILLGNDTVLQQGTQFRFPNGKLGRVNFKLPGSHPTPSGVAYDPGQEGLGH